MVGAGAADRVLAVLGPVTATKRQVNHIFDTPSGRLRAERYAVRLRLEDGVPIVTVKGPSQRVGAHTSARTEAEAVVDSEQARGILSGDLDPVAALQSRVASPAYAALYAGLERARRGEPLRVVGSFENVRRTIDVELPGELRLIVELDRTSLPGGSVDEEIEIELTDVARVAEVEAWLEARAAAAGVELRASSPKVSRFYAALERARS